jgi:hypothetical protein
MNKKSKKRLYNKRRKTMRGGGSHSRRSNKKGSRKRNYDLDNMSDISKSDNDSRTNTLEKYQHTVKLDLEKIINFADVFPKDHKTQEVQQIYLVAYHDTDDEEGIDGYQEYIGIVESKNIKEKEFKFIPYLSREYLYGNGAAADEYTRWKKGQTFQIFEFDKIDIYKFN